MRSVTIFHKVTVVLMAIYRSYIVGNLQRNETNEQHTLDRRLCGLTVQYKIKLCRTLQGRPGRQNCKASP